MGTHTYICIPDRRKKTDIYTYIYIHTYSTCTYIYIYIYMYSENLNNILPRPLYHHNPFPKSDMCALCESKVRQAGGRVYVERVLIELGIVIGEINRYSRNAMLANTPKHIPFACEELQVGQILHRLAIAQLAL